MGRACLAAAWAAALALGPVACGSRDDAGSLKLSVSSAYRLELEGYDNSVQDLAVGEEGVWGLFRAEPLVRFLPMTAGAQSRRFGREGRGPGELGWPRAIVQRSEVGASGEGVFVLDPARRAIVALDGTGALVSTLAAAFEGNGAIRRSIEQLMYGRPFRMRAARGGLVMAAYPAGMHMPVDLRRGELIWVDPHSGARRELLTFETLLSENAESTVLPRLPLWDVCGTELVVYDPDGSQLLFFEIGGGRRRIQRIEWPERDLRGDEARNYLRQALLVETQGQIAPQELEPMINQAHRRTAHLFPETAPQIADLLCGTDGSVWLEAFDARRSPLGHSSSWTRMGPRGTTARLLLPDGFRPYRFEKDRAVGLMEEAFGDLHPFVFEFTPVHPVQEEAVQ